MKLIIYPGMAGFYSAILLSILIQPAVSTAQISDSLQLEPVTVEASRLPIPWNRQPVHISLIDSASAESAGSATLGDLLQFHSSVSVRRYGEGGLSSVSVRGFGPRQTQLVWNGFVINHPMLGQLDYSLFPVNMAGNIRVVTGNSSAGFGSGAVGGSVMMDSREIRNQTSVSFTQGAWGRFGGSVSTGFDTGKYRLGVNFYGVQAVNDYPYFDTLRQRDRRRQNNQYSRQHVQINAGMTRDRIKYDTSFWYGDATHFIAGPVTVTNPDARQDDRFLLWSNVLNYMTDAGLWKLSGLYNRYALDYAEPRSGINSESLVNRREFRLTYRRLFSDVLHLAAGSELKLSGIETNNFAETKNRTITSGWMQAEITPVSFLNVYPSARFDYYTDAGRALTGSLGVNVQTPLNWLHLRAQVATSYNAPTLNDMYWSPGGNPELEPERSVSLETGLSAEYIRRNGGVRFGLTGYRIWFDDGIQWLPGQGGIWSPVNIIRIDSRGLEAEVQGRYRYRGLRTTIIAALGYTESTSPAEASGTGEIRNLQLPYVPKWTRKVSAGLQFKPVFVQISWQSVSSRFTTSDHSSPLDPLEGFDTLTISTGVNIKLRNLDAVLSYTLHNLENNDYQVMAWYPMPPRYHLLNLKISINH